VKSLGDPEGMPGGAAPDGTAGRRRDRRSPVFLVIAGTVAVLFFVLFVALGTWQVKRRVWKLDLIARVEQRVHAPPAAAPGPAEWPNVTAAADEYRHVAATGTFLDDSQTLVQAVTDLGAGYWVLTPLRLADGSIVLVNRGFVAGDDRDRVQPAAAARVIGLLRMTEPRGGFLRHNDPAANRWYSRDVQAIAAARGLTRVAPFLSTLRPLPTNRARRRRRPRIKHASRGHRRRHPRWHPQRRVRQAMPPPIVPSGRPMGARWSPWQASPSSPSTTVTSSTRSPGIRLRSWWLVQYGSGSAVKRARSAEIDPHVFDDSTGLENMRQLIQLRWIAVVGQIVTIAVVNFAFDIHLPLRQMSVVLICLVAFNIASMLRWRAHHEVTNGELFFALLVDVTTLTAQLYLSGGATNPFSFLYLLQVILGAVLLRAWSVWTMVGITAACFTGLTLFYRPLALPGDYYGMLFGPYMRAL